MWDKLENYWREVTFNIKRDRELVLNRRGFIAASLTLLGGLFLSSFPFTIKAMQRKEAPEQRIEPLKIAEAEELAIGESKLFAFPTEEDAAILVRLSEREYRSYQIKCTHLGCPVFWDKPSEQLKCPCHNGIFSVLDGSVIAGPPPRPLTTVKLTVRRSGVFAVGLVKGA
ncbi:Rieske Fe-S protein [Paenibacillus phyllosphaerae]|uniref:Rieske Fe-S protein n=1 Tax=Paenibacillus phyllosphaerae TaxID=274593 RepID=A0A7W5FN52_9BACL|nr:Rieske (2Fe-2S) protein [Paenibacillus phyllosphaerae]MBB3110951.1 Rieske Fe-S protein [Paenibacillus phyllosphaerae]